MLQKYTVNRTDLWGTWVQK